MVYQHHVNDLIEYNIVSLPHYCLARYVSATLLEWLKKLN